MALTSLNFEQVGERDLDALIDAGISEGLLIDYKEASYGRSDSDVKEFLKDLSSFANSSGGHLLVGMREVGGSATQIVPLSGNPDQELQRLENLARDGLEPRVAGLRMRAIPVTGGFVILVRIPRSWAGPHRVSARGTNRIYARNSAGAYEVSMDELRIMFAAGISLHDRVRAYRADRLARIDAGETVVELMSEPSRVVVHIVPYSAFALPSQVDVADAHSLHEKLRPIHSMGYTPTINFEGFANIRGGQPSPGYTQIFRNGIIEAVKCRAIGENNGIRYLPSLSFDERLWEVLPNYFDALRALEISPPLVCMITVQGIKGAILGVSNAPDDETKPFNRSILELPECVIENYGNAEDYQRTLRPAFDALWNAAGYFRSANFDETGKWIGKRR